MMMKRVSVLRLVAGLAGAMLVAAAQADSVSGNFLHENGSPSATSGGSVTFTLNGDGTIAASLTSLDGGIIGFGFDSVNPNLPESGFPPGQPANPYGWLGSYGYFPSGFLASTPYPASMTWTIGNPGDYSSVSQVLGGPNLSWDFYMFSGPGNEWAAVAAVPEPQTYAMLALGLGVLGWMRSRRARA